MAGQRLHVVPYNGRWAVKRENAIRASGIYDTKNEAIEEARKMAWRNNDEVIVHDKHGKIIPGKRYGKDPDEGDCFITTACITHYHLGDNCFQLKTLRTFRDSYLIRTSEGKQLVRLYYSIAPKLVAQINTSKKKNTIYEKIFQEINAACNLIKKQKNEEAKSMYIKIIGYLIKKFQIL